MIHRWFTGLRARLLALALLAVLPLVAWLMVSEWRRYQTHADVLRADALHFTQTLAVEHATHLESMRAVLTGMSLLPATLLSDRALCDKQLAEIHAQFSLLANLSVALPNGVVICSALPHTGQVNFADRAWFMDAMARKQFSSIEYIVGRIAKKPVAVSGLPVLRDGAVSHLLAATLDLDWFRQRLATSNLPEDSVFLLTDARGILLLRAPVDMGLTGQSIASSSLAPLLALRSAQGLELTGLDGVQRHYSVTPLGTDGTPAAFLAIGIPTGALYAPATQTLWLGATVLGLLLLLILALFIGADRWIVMPLHQLDHAAQRIAGGEPAPPLPVEADGEIGQLAQAFSYMLKKLTEREHLLAESQRIAHIGSWSFDVATQRVTWTDETFRLHGLVPRAMAPVYPETLVLIHSEDVPLIGRWLEDCLAGKNPPPLEHRTLWPNGETHWLVGGGELIRDANGTPVEIIGTVQDITGRKQTESAMRDAHDQLAKVIATSPGIVCSFRLRSDGSTCVPFGSERVTATYGIPSWRLAEDAAPFLAQTHPDDIDGLQQAIAESARDLTPFRHEWRVRHPTHGVLWMEVHSVPQREPDGSTLWHGIAGDITTRKQIEVDLHESEERLHLALTATKDVIWDWDVLTDKQTWSTSGPNVFGWMDITLTPQTAKWWLDRVHPEDRDRVTESFHICLDDSSRFYWEDEYRFAHQDGHYLHVADRGFVVRNKSGKAIRMVGAMRDVTRLMQTQDALQVEQERLRLALDAAHMGTWDWDLQSSQITWSSWHETIWGYQPGEFHGTYDDFLARIHPDDLVDIQNAIDRCQLTREPYRCDYRVIWPDGSTHWVAGRGEFEFNTDGSARRMRGAVMEITERKQAEAALRTSEQRWQFALEGARDGVWDWNLVTNEVFFSRRWKEMLGFADDEITGSLAEWDRRVHPDDKARTYADIEKHLHGTTPYYENEHRVLCKDGSYKWILDRGRVISHDAAGKPSRMIGTHTDITERKLAEERIAAGSARLELLSRQLLEAQEVERRHVARELHDEIGQLLTVVKLGLQRVLRQSASEPVAAVLQDSMASIDQVMLRVRELSLDLRPSMLDDLGLIPTLRWYTQRLAKGVGDTVDLQVILPAAATRLPSVIETACFRVAQAALTNCLRHAQASEISVTLEIAATLLKLQIRDNGVGFNVAEAWHKGQSGTGGFGLLGMQERVELSGGEFHIESTPGRGTLVTIRFALEPDSNIPA